MWCPECVEEPDSPGCFYGWAVYLHEYKEDENLLFDTPEETEEYAKEYAKNTIWQWEIHEVEK